MSKSLVSDALEIIKENKIGGIPVTSMNGDLLGIVQC